MKKRIAFAALSVVWNLLVIALSKATASFQQGSYEFIIIGQFCYNIQIKPRYKHRIEIIRLLIF